MKNKNNSNASIVLKKCKINWRILYDIIKIPVRIQITSVLRKHLHKTQITY